METLVLLSALVLLAFQALADPLPEASEETKDEEQLEVENQDMSISFGEPEGSVLQDAASADWICTCRKKSCRNFEQVSGVCKISTEDLTLCHG